MTRVPQPAGQRGSLRWIQDFVNRRSDDLDDAIQSVSNGRIATPIRWVSPVEDDDYAEYRDEAFLNRLGISLPKRSLDSFWPRGGPQWDALGVDASGVPILVEAKANIPEVISSPTQAGAGSREVILAALSETAEHLGATSTCDWSGTFYQYANRLAHLFLLSELNDVEAWLVFVYFVGDAEVDGPKSEAEWRAAIQILEGALGLRRHPLLSRRVEVFIPVAA